MNRRDVLKSAAVPAGVLVSGSVLGAPCTPSLALDGPAPPPTNCGPITAPSWLSSAADNSWINVRVAAGQPTSTQLREVTSGNVVSTVTGTLTNYPADSHVIGVWCGAIVMPDYYALVAEGGHMRTSDNGVYVFGPFSSETPSWTRVHTSDVNISNDSNPYYTTGRPASRHGYCNSIYIPDLGAGVGNEWFSYQCGAPYVAGGDNSAAVQSYQFPTPPNTPGGSTAGAGAGSYDPEGFNPAFPPGTKRGLLEQGAFAWDPGDQVGYAFGGPFSDLWEWDPVARQWRSTPLSPSPGSSYSGKSGAIDYNRRIALAYRAGGGGTVSITDIGSAHKGDNFEINPGGANPESVGSSGGRPGIAYEPVGGKFVCWNGLGNLYRLNVPAGFRNGTEDPSQPITVTSGWEWELVPGIIGAPPDAVSSGVYTKFHYIDSIQCLATQAFVESDMHVFKVPANGL